MAAAGKAQRSRLEGRGGCVWGAWSGGDKVFWVSFQVLFSHDLWTSKLMVLNPSRSVLLFYSKYCNSPHYYPEMKSIHNITYLNILTVI